LLKNGNLEEQNEFIKLNLILDNYGGGVEMISRIAYSNQKDPL
jgi:hypothetical protein